jgi:hypothetical protein
LKETATYTYYIHNFSRNGSNGLSNSGAVVKVYFGNSTVAAYEFTVPAGSGYNWYVFTYNAYTGEFIINNTISG